MLKSAATAKCRHKLQTTSHTLHHIKLAMVMINILENFEHLLKFQHHPISWIAPSPTPSLAITIVMMMALMAVMIIMMLQVKIATSFRSLVFYFWYVLWTLVGFQTPHLALLLQTVKVFCICHNYTIVSSNGTPFQELSQSISTIFPNRSFVWLLP